MRKCFACDRELPMTKMHLVACIDDQAVWVGSECFKHIKRSGIEGYQPPRGGPKLYTIEAKVHRSTLN